MSQNDKYCNSNKSKEPPKEEVHKIEKVATGKIRKKNFFEKAKDALFSNDDANDIGNYILHDIVIKAGKNVIADITASISDAIITTVETALFGESGRRKSSTNYNKIYYSNPGNVSFRAFRDSNTGKRDYGTTTNSRNNLRFDDIVFPNRGEAQATLVELDEALSMYQLVTVSDYYDAAGITAPHTYNNYGWDDLRNAKVVPLTGGGYTIKFPKAMPIN